MFADSFLSAVVTSTSINCNEFTGFSHVEISSLEPRFKLTISIGSSAS